MAVVHAVVAVGAAPTLLVSAGARFVQSPAFVDLENSGASTVFVGGAQVATTGALKGRPLAAGSTARFDLASGDDLYAVSAAGGEVCVLRTGA